MRGYQGERLPNVVREQCNYMFGFGDQAIATHLHWEILFTCTAYPSKPENFWLLFL